MSQPGGRVPATRAVRCRVLVHHPGCNVEAAMVNTAGGEEALHAGRVAHVVPRPVVGRICAERAGIRASFTSRDMDTLMQRTPRYVITLPRTAIVPGKQRGVVFPALEHPVSARTRAGAVEAGLGTSHHLQVTAPSAYCWLVCVTWAIVAVPVTTALHEIIRHTCMIQPEMKGS